MRCPPCNVGHHPNCIQQFNLDDGGKLAYCACDNWVHGEWLPAFVNLDSILDEAIERMEDQWLPFSPRDEFLMLPDVERLMRSRKDGFLLFQMPDFYDDEPDSGVLEDLASDGQYQIVALFRVEPESPAEELRATITELESAAKELVVPL